LGCRKDVQSEAEILERARSLCSEGCFAVALQHRRLRSKEPEDEVFILRWWTDLQFLIVSLRRLRRSALTAAHVRGASDEVTAAVRQFDQALPALRKMRNVGEHVDSYAVDAASRHEKSVSRLQLQVGSWDGTVYSWLGGSLNVDVALNAAEKLLEAIWSCIERSKTK